MKFIYEHLKIKADTAPQTAELLTMHTQEVEKVESHGVVAKGVITAKITDIQQHPHADKLRIATIDIGSEILDIVTGAPNAEIGHIVPFAPVGAYVRAIDHSTPGAMLTSSVMAIIKPVTLRGILSPGMVCGADELGLSNEETKGVYVFPHSTPIGTPVDKIIPSSHVIETDDKGTAHRPDLLSYRGIEIELAAVLKKSYHDQMSTLPKLHSVADLKVQVFDQLLCPLFLVAKIDVMSVKESPAWMQQFLHDHDIKIINLPTDITNYAMLSEGHPTHAFDADAIDGTIQVRHAHKGESVQTLDHKTHVLTEEDIVLANSQSAIDIAGIIGGVHSAVTSNSTGVVLTCAVFDPKHIRKTSRRLGVRTEAASRFERGLSVASAINAFSHTLSLFNQFSGGTVTAVYAVGNTDIKQTKIKLDINNINSSLGTQLTENEIHSILENLSYTIEQNECVVPWRRTDIHSLADVAEDVARMYGYNRIPSVISILETGAHNTKQHTVAQLLRQTAAQYLYEVQTSSMVTVKNESAVEIQNPIGSKKHIRQSLLPELFTLAEYYTKEGYQGYGCFEIGNTYRINSFGKIDEKNRFGAVMQADPEELKSILGILLHRLNIDTSKISFVYCPQSEDRPTRYDSVYKIQYEKVLLGHIIAHNYGKRIYSGLKLYIETLSDIVQLNQPFKNYSHYPSIKRTITFVIDKDINVSSVKDKILQFPTPEQCIEEVPNVSQYTGSDVVQSGKKSISMEIVFRCSNRSLTDEEVNKITDQITDMLKKDYGATIR